MTSEAFTHLLSEISLGNCVLRNRIASTGHHTHFADKQPNAELIAYHEARAAGGAGLIICEIITVHESAGFSGNLLSVQSDDAILAYKRLTDACHKHGAKIFAQLFHPGREVLSTSDGLMAVAWAPSAVPNERFHIMPKPMSALMIRDVIAGYGQTAASLLEAGFDGFEIVASHGFLPSQFLNPRTNLREDEYGGDDTRRMRFLDDVINVVRQNADDRAVGLRISGFEQDSLGLSEEEVVDICASVAPRLDYLNITAGTSASLGGSVHITPPMGIEQAYMARQTASIKTRVSIPVLLSGRVNQPQVAEQVIARGDADICGMTRALICDPLMPAKTQMGKLDAIRSCIACNQACIGRALKDLGVSCIQYPESGRELEYAKLPAIKQAKKILVAGGGPAGMKAAAIAAQRGHEVELFESAPQLGGQALLAQRLPGREEFGGIVGNLEYELRDAGVIVKTNTALTSELVLQSNASALIVATGAQPYVPVFEGYNDKRTITAWDVLQGKPKIGASVVIADWRADWIGLGIAEQLAVAGCNVTLCVNAAMAGETLQLYTRNHYVGRLHKLGVRIITHLRLFGFIDDTVFFEDTLSDAALALNGTETLVLSLGHLPQDNLTRECESLGIDTYSIGDCVSARTAEEAVLEGLQIGWKI